MGSSPVAVTVGAGLENCVPYWKSDNKFNKISLCNYSSRRNKGGVPSKICNTTQSEKNWFSICKTRLKLSCSQLNEHKLENSIINSTDKLCSYSLELGCLSRFLLDCYYFKIIRSIFYDECRLIHKIFWILSRLNA